MENLLLPSKVEYVAGDTPESASLLVTPCYFGYGTTLGNTLRRVLLSSLPGGAVEAFKIKGVQHEFSAVEGVKEDVVQIIFNLKQLAVKVHVDEPVVLTLFKKGPGVVTAADIEKNANVEVVSGDAVIATLTSNKNFEMEIIVGKGRGYKPVEEKDRQSYDLGTIVIDSVYTPIKDVGYSVEYTRVGDITNYEKLTLNIETNGTISPEEAVREAAQIIMDHFNIVLNGPKVEEEKKEKKEETKEETKEEPAAREEEVKEEKEEKKETKKKPAKAKKSAKKK